VVQKTIVIWRLEPPPNKKELIGRKTLRQRKRGGRKKTDVPMNYFTDSKFKSHAMILKSHRGREGVGGSNTQAGEWKC